MKKVYVVAPLVGLIVFSVLYWDGARRYNARLIEETQRAEAAKLEKERLKELAIANVREQAAAALEQKRREQAEAERLEETRRLAKTDAEQRRADAFAHVKALQLSLERLRRDVATAQADVKSLETRKTSLRQEQEFIANYVRQAEADRAAFFQLIDKLDNLERTKPVAPPARSLP